MAYIGFAPATTPLTANDIVDGVLTSAKIADGAVTTVKIADGNVTTAKIADANVISSKIANGNIISSKIADGNVLTAKIALANVTSEIIANANVRTHDIEIANVTTELLQDDAVTSTKIAPIKNLQEDILITASAALANTTINVLDNSVRYFTSASSGNICINVRGNDSTTLNSMMETGNTITSALIITNGSTAYLASNTQVDNVAVVPKVQGGDAIVEGNANSTDIYTITVLKTADATFTMFLSQTQYA